MRLSGAAGRRSEDGDSIGWYWPGWRWLSGLPANARRWPTMALGASQCVGPHSRGRARNPKDQSTTFIPGGGGKARTSLFGVAGEGYSFVYVFDRSGSMGGSGRTLLQMVKGELLKSLRNLGETQQFQMIFYNDRPTLFNPSGVAGKLAFGNENNKQRAIQFIGLIVAEGGTDHLEALRAATGMHPDVIFFLTDGDRPKLTDRELEKVQRLGGGNDHQYHPVLPGSAGGGNEFSGKTRPAYRRSVRLRRQHPAQAGGNRPARGSALNTSTRPADHPHARGPVHGPHLMVAELEQALRMVDRRVFLAPPRILRRVIRQDCQLPGMTLRIPHRKSYAILREPLLKIVEKPEIGLDVEEPLPEKVLLLARPDQARLDGETAGQTLLRYWRLLFHLRIHLAMDQRRQAGQLDPVAVAERLARIGQVEFEEIRAVLEQEAFLLPPRDDPAVYVEFTAVALELKCFAPGLLACYFPAIEDWPTIDKILAEDVDDAALLAATRLPGAPDPMEQTASGERRAASSLPRSAGATVGQADPDAPYRRIGRQGWFVQRCRPRHSPHAIGHFGRPVGSSLSPAAPSGGAGGGSGKRGAVGHLPGEGPTAGVAGAAGEDPGGGKERRSAPGLPPPGSVGDRRGRPAGVARFVGDPGRPGRVGDLDHRGPATLRFAEGLRGPRAGDLHRGPGGVGRVLGSASHPSRVAQPARGADVQAPSQRHPAAGRGPAERRAAGAAFQAAGRRRHSGRAAASPAVAAADHGRLGRRGAGACEPAGEGRPAEVDRGAVGSGRRAGVPHHGRSARRPVAQQPQAPRLRQSQGLSPRRPVAPSRPPVGPHAGRRLPPGRVLPPLDAAAQLAGLRHQDRPLPHPLRDGAFRRGPLGTAFCRSRGREDGAYRSPSLHGAERTGAGVVALGADLRRRLPPRPLVGAEERLPGNDQRRGARSALGRRLADRPTGAQEPRLPARASLPG